MKHFDLPIECQNFLQNNENTVIDFTNQSLEVEKAIFYKLDELKSDFQIIDTYEYFLNHNEFTTDPEKQYHIPAINLIKEDADGNYDSDGLIVWFPDIKCFGTCDTDHCIGYLFKDITWLEIEANLGNFVNTQWYPEKSKNILFKPWKEQGFGFDFDQYKKND